MISTVFAPNEGARDMTHALIQLFQPWKWLSGKSIPKLRTRLKKRFFWDTSTVHFSLTARACLYHFLKSHNLPSNSEVLVQGFTCAAAVLPILSLKLNPIYVDINENDFSMNFEDLKRKYTPAAKVLILQHTFGITPSERIKIIQFAKEKKLILLEDLAHGFDPELYKDKSQYGSLLLSFGRSKAISSVFGGAIVSKYKKVDEYFSLQEKQLKHPSYFFLLKVILYKCFAYSIKALHDIYIGRIIHFAFRASNLFEPEISKKEKSGQYDWHYSKSFPNICAEFVLHQLQTYNDVLERKKQNSAFFTKELEQNENYKKASLRFPFITDSRDAILKKAAKKRLILGTWYSQVIAPEEINLTSLYYKQGTCPNAESICKRILNLPTFVTKKQAKQIVSIIKSI